MMSSSYIHIKMAKCAIEVSKTINKEQSELVIGEGTLPEVEAVEGKVFF